MKDFQSLPDLASQRLGGRVIAANDEFFAPKENLLKASKPIFIEGKIHLAAVSGWTAGRRAAAARPATIGASSASACPESSVASSWTPASSEAIIPRALFD
jgi:allantoicase